MKPLALHFDNTWNSGLATQNIRNLVEALNVDLITYVIDFEEFDRCLLAFIENDILDLEL